MSHRSGLEEKKSSGGTVIVSPPASIIGRVQPTAPGRMRTGSTSSGVRRATAGNTFRSVWLICGATSRRKVWQTASRHMSTPAYRRRPQGGGKATKPGATCAPAAPWASSTAPPACGSGGSTPTKAAMRPTFWRLRPDGERRSALKDPHTWGA